MTPVKLGHGLFSLKYTSTGHKSLSQALTSTGRSTISTQSINAEVQSVRAVMFCLLSKLYSF